MPLTFVQSCLAFARGYGEDHSLNRCHIKSIDNFLTTNGMKGFS